MYIYIYIHIYILCIYIYIYDDAIPNPNHLSSPKNLWCSLHSSSSIPANVQGCGPGKGPQVTVTVTWGFHPFHGENMMENHGKPMRFGAFRLSPNLFGHTRVGTIGYVWWFQWFQLITWRYSEVFFGGDTIIGMSPTKLETINECFALFKTPLESGGRLRINFWMSCRSSILKQQGPDPMLSRRS